MAFDSSQNDTHQSAIILTLNSINLNATKKIKDLIAIIL